MKITEEKLLEIITEEIKNLFEIRNIVDNFDLISKMMEFNDSDDYYFLQIIKRKKDNPNDDITKGNYHSGGWYLDSFHIHSSDELLSLKDKIIDICDKNNARAYITVNKRSEKATARQIIKVKRMFKPNDPRYIHADDIVSGQTKHGPNWAGQRLRFMIDIDSTNTKIWDECHKIIKLCGMEPLGEYKTPSGGLHIILPNKEHENIEYLLGLLRKFDNWLDKGPKSTAHTIFDSKILLYSNIDAKGY